MEKETSGAAGAGEVISACGAKASRVAEILSAEIFPGGVGSPATSAEPRMEFCVPVSLASQEDEPEDGDSAEALSETGLTSSGDESGHESCAGADGEGGVCGDELIDGAKLGMAVAVPDALIFSEASPGAVAIPAAGARFVL